MTTVDADPYAAYTEQAEDYDVGWAELDEVLPPFTAGLLAAAGRLLATLAYRDALDYGDRPFKRRSPKARHRVLAKLPTDCDRQDQAFRLRLARSLNDLAGDIEAGRAPLPRCTGERHALELMIDCAPQLLACSDAELRQLGIPVPDTSDEYDYHAPYWDPVWSEFIVDGAEDSIPEAQATAEDQDQPEPPPDGWTAPRFWFSPYGITTVRDPGRRHPDWVTASLDGSEVVEPEPQEFARAARLLGFTDRADPWQAYTDEYRDEGRCLAEVLTPLGAALLEAAARELVARGYEEVVAYGDRPFDRDAAEDDYSEDDSDDGFLALLPPVCDGQNAAWRLAMVRAVNDLAEDLRAGRAPLPRCNAEEIALHLILSWAAALLEDLDDPQVAAEHGVPTREAFTVRHRQFAQMRETFLQDDDFMMFYDAGMAEVAGDPDHLAMRYLHVGDIRPPSWWWTFGNLRPRDAARGFDPRVLERLASSPALRFTGPEGVGEPEGSDTIPVLSAGLVEEFELFVGLAQRRFFDRRCAVAMARSLARLLTAFLDAPDLHVHRVWMLGQCAVVGEEMLIVDEDFSIDGHRHTWRLHADQTDGQARTWTLRLLADCSTKILLQYATAAPELLLDMDHKAPPPVDQALPQTLAERSRAMGQSTTLAGFLRYRRRILGVDVGDVAEAAILPSAVVAGWEAGGPAAPSQLIRCAPVLQLPEAVLLTAADGRRDPGYWPLPAIRATAHGSEGAE
ncbi:hypothetical protein [Amycolatopsis benzoatilytica]|uniref:hypothetical protein n=1 Tax=Amycolatopsis benzoatilytica TaxID=346045 RepID=UPI00037F8D50|nr:hypothetical protein [Amycolatopsis benzoatilytica]